MDLTTMQREIIALAFDVGVMLRDVVHTQKTYVEKSSTVDLVTVYDQAAEEMIVSYLQTHYPTHQIEAEEGNGKIETDSPYCWYIDPIDGTTNFAHGFPHFAISIALYEDAIPLLAVIYDPMKDECFTASKKGGAYLLYGNQYYPLLIGQSDRINTSLLATGFPYDRHDAPDNNWQQFGAFLRKAQGMRRAGAASLDLAYVAAGRLDGYWEYKLKSWDVAAGILLIQEAGGTVTAINNEPIVLNSSISLLATNGRIHKEMQSVLKVFPKMGMK